MDHIKIPLDLGKIKELKKNASFIMKHELLHREMLISEYQQSKLAADRALHKNKNFFFVYETMVQANLRDLYFLEPGIRDSVEANRELFCQRENLRDHIEKEIFLCQKKETMEQKIKTYQSMFQRYVAKGWELKDKIFELQVEEIKERANV